jgi:hypothetical protein
VRALAVVLLLLVASPFTEPFSVCSPALLASASTVRPSSTAPHSPAIGCPIRRDAGYPPLSLTDDQLKDAKDVLPAPVPAPHDTVGLVSAVYVTTVGASARPAHPASVLRI